MTTPPLPPGFELETTGGTPPLPPGFELERGGGSVVKAAPPQQPNLLDRLGHNIQGSFTGAQMGGFAGLVARKFYEGIGTGRDQVRAAHPNWSDQQVEIERKRVIRDTVLEMRAKAGKEVEDNNFNINTHIPNPLEGFKKPINIDPVSFLPGAVGGADPTYFINPGSAIAKGAGARAVVRGVAKNAAAQAAFGSATDAAYQGADIIDQMQKDFDWKRNLSAAGAQGVLGAAHAGATVGLPKVSNFVKELYKGRGVDTTPAAQPLARTTPFTGQGLNPAEMQEYHSVLQTGDVHDIRGFFDGRNTPPPSFEAAHEWVKRRDGAAAPDAPPRPPEGFEPEHPSNLGTEELTSQMVGPTGDQRPAIQAHIDEQTKDWKNKPDFELINHVDDIADPEVRESVRHTAGDDALGFVGPDNKVRIFADRMDSPETLNAVMYHEALGHYGLGQAFGDRLDKTIGTLLKRNVSQFGKDTEAWMKKNPGAYEGNRIRAAEEVLANMSNTGTMKKSLADALTAQVRGFGRKMGLNLSYNDAEVRRILAMAHDAVINGKGRDVRGNGFKFMFTGEKAKNFSRNDPTAFTPSDGITRNEISDRTAKLKENIPDNVSGPLHQVLDHPELYHAYPQLKDLEVKHYNMEKMGMDGGYDPADKSIHIHSGLEHSKKREALLHEVQHSVQDIENYPTFAKDRDHGSAHLADISWDEYRNHPAEKEAYLTQDRMDMTNNQRLENEPKFMHRSDLAPSANDNVRISDLSPEKQEKWRQFALRDVLRDIKAAKDAIQEIGERDDLTPEKRQKLIDRRTSLLNRHEKQRQRLMKARADDLDYVVPSYVKDAMERSESDGPRFMRKGDLQPKDVAEEAYNRLDRQYVPKTRSWEQTKELADKTALNPAMVRESRSVGNLDRKLFVYDDAAKEANSTLMAIHEKANSPEGLTAEDHVAAIKAAADFHYTLGRIENDATQIARALNAMKAIEFSRNNLMKLKKALDESETNMAALSDPDTMIKFLRQYHSMAILDNPKGAQTMLRSVSQPYWWQYALSFRQNMMLSGLSTHAKASMDMATMIGRDLQETALAMPGSAVREALRALGAKNIEPGLHPTELAMRLWGLTRAALEAKTYTDSMHHITHGSGTNRYANIADPRIPIVSKVGDIMSAQDTFFRAFHNNANLYALAAREMYTAAKVRSNGGHVNWQEVMSDAAALSRQPTRGMLNEAHELTEHAILLNRSPLNSVFDKAKVIRPGMNGWEQTGSFMANYLTPFIRTGSNAIMNQIVRRSPLAFLDPMTRSDLKAGGARSDIAMSRIALGTALLGYYWAAADPNKTDMTGEGPDNPAKFKELQASGWNPNSIKENGRYNRTANLNISLNPLDRHNNVAMMVAGLRDAMSKGAHPGQIATGIGLAMNNLLHTFANQSYLADLGPFIDAATAKGLTAPQRVARYAGDQAKTFVPNLMQQFDRIADPNRRDTSSDSQIETVLNEAKSGVPLLSQQLPVKYNVYGKPIQTGTSLTGVHTWVSPGNGQKETTDPGELELARLAKLTPAAVVTAVQKTVSVDGMKVKLDATQHNEYQKEAGQAIVQAIKDQMNSGTWAQLSDADKIRTVRSIQTQAKSEVRDALLQKEGWLKPDQLDKLRTEMNAK